MRSMVRAKAKQHNLHRSMWCSFRSARLFAHMDTMSRKVDSSRSASGTPAPPSATNATRMMSM